jgi:hypothetical protein
MQPLKIGDYVEVVDEKSPSYKNRGVVESIWLNGALFVNMGNRSRFFKPEELRRIE